MDPISATFMTFGVVLLIASWIYLIVIAFGEDFAWGLCTVLVPPLSYIYSCFAWKQTQEALWMAIGGFMLIAVALV